MDVRKPFSKAINELLGEHPEYTVEIMKLKPKID